MKKSLIILALLSVLSISVNAAGTNSFPLLEATRGLFVSTNGSPGASNGWVLVLTNAATGRLVYAPQTGTGDSSTNNLVAITFTNQLSGMDLFLDTNTATVYFRTNALPPTYTERLSNADYSTNNPPGFNVLITNGAARTTITFGWKFYGVPASTNWIEAWHISNGRTNVMGSQFNANQAQTNGGMMSFSANPLGIYMLTNKSSGLSVSFFLTNLYNVITP